MISLLISLAVLIIGYLVYGKAAEKIFSPDDRPTPAIAYPVGAACAAALFITYIVFLVKRLKSKALTA